MISELKEFLSKSGCVIITDSPANINRLMRRWNRYDKADFCNCSVMSLSMIAGELVNAYSAVHEPEHIYDQITSPMRNMIMYSILADMDIEAIPEESKSIKTASEILRCLDMIRSNDPTDEYLDSADPHVGQMKELLSVYESKLISQYKLDHPALIKKAFDCLDAISKDPDPAASFRFYLPGIKGSVCTFFFKELTLIEERFIKKLETVSGATFTVFDPVNDPAPHRPTSQSPEYTFYEGYGAANEVRFVADRITDDRIPAGECLVVYAGTEYENTIKAIFEARGISYSFPGGMHAASTDYVAFMLGLIRFVQDDYSYRSLEPVVENPLFNLKGAARSYRKILDHGIGWGRSRYRDFISSYEEGGEEEEQAFVAFLGEILETFDESSSCARIYAKLIGLADKYTRNTDRLRNLVKESLKGGIRVFSFVRPDEALENRLNDIREYLEEYMTDLPEETSSVSVIPYGRTFITDRRVLFAVGLSGENIAGIHPESPVFSDDELRRFVNGPIDDAAGINLRCRQNFERSLEWFEGSDIFIGSSTYDTVSLLGNSRSLLYADLMRRAGQDESDIQRSEYEVLSGDVSVDLDRIFDEIPENGTDEDAEKNPPAYFSASSLQTLLYCPLQYYYKKIEYVPELSFADRTPDRWLAPNQKGNLFHHVMENYVNEAVIDADIRSADMPLIGKIFEKELEEALLAQPCPSDAIYEAEKEECFLAIVRYINILHDELNSTDIKVIGAELRFEGCKYNGGTVIPGKDGKASIDGRYEIFFTGSADRVDGYVKDGILNLKIIDYKTGSPDKKRSEIKENTQIQHYVYAIAVKNWADSHLDELSVRFGEKIEKTRIDGMKYVFPFEDPVAEIDVSELVAGEDPKLDDTTDSVISLVIGAMQHGRNAAAMEFMDCYTDGRVADVDYCRYCTYMNVCRHWIR